MQSAHAWSDSPRASNCAGRGSRKDAKKLRSLRQRMCNMMSIHYPRVLPLLELGTTAGQFKDVKAESSRQVHEAAAHAERSSST